MAGIAFEAAARVLVVLHALAAFALAGAATHHAIVVLGYFRGIYRVRLGKIYGAIVGVLFLLTFVLGGTAYPAFRYYVRALYLDRYEPWASNLFDIKEHLSSLALPLALAGWALSRSFDPKTQPGLLWPYALVTFGPAVVVWFNIVAGLIVTLERGL